MIKKGYLIGFIASVIVFAISVVMIVCSVFEAGKQTDLGLDVSNYGITKMETDNETYRIAGTQSGEVFAFDMDGNILWNVGTPRTTAIYEIARMGENVFVVYASGEVISFTWDNALAYGNETKDAHSKLSKEQFDAKCMVYETGYTFNTSGNVRNTQLLLNDKLPFFLLRGVFNDVSRVNQLYKFKIGVTSPTRLVATSSGFGGAALTDDGTIYFATRGQISEIANGETVPKKIADVNENIIAVSLFEKSIATITAQNNMIIVDAENTENISTYAIDKKLNTNFVFSTGENFIAKINNGGFALISSQTHKITLSMKAPDAANLLMWTEKGFAIRNEVDVNNPTISYYSMDLAARITLFNKLLIVFIVLAVVFLLASAYTGFSMVDRCREAIHGKFFGFFKALVRYKFIYLTLLVPIALLIIFYYIPITLGFGMSFFDYIPGEKMLFVGAKNFAAVLLDTQFWSSVLTMLSFLVADILKALIPPIFIAEFIFAVKNKRYSLWVRILLFLPGVLPGVATTLVWSSGIFGASENSLINAFIRLFSPTFLQNWVYNASNSLSIGTLIAFGFPWIGSYLIFFGAISGINTSVFEASRLDGCGWVKRMIKIDLPLILPQIKYIFITSFIASVQNYTSIYILHGINGQIQTPALLMYGEIMKANYGTASVMGILIFAFLSVATVLNFKMQSDKS